MREERSAKSFQLSAVSRQQEAPYGQRPASNSWSLALLANEVRRVQTPEILSLFADR
jgi:hypothetical protein